MKIVLAAFVLMILVGVVTFYSGIKNYNPDADGKKARESIKAGMTWQEVIQATTPPLQYQLMVPDPEHPDVIGPANPARKFNLAEFQSMLDNGSAAHGFVFSYTYSDREQFNVTFDADRKVDSVTQRMGMVDLLKLR